MNEVPHLFRMSKVPRMRKGRYLIAIFEPGNPHGLGVCGYWFPGMCKHIPLARNNMAGNWQGGKACTSSPSSSSPMHTRGVASVTYFDSTSRCKYELVVNHILMFMLQTRRA